MAVAVLPVVLPAQQIYKQPKQLMGSHFEITVVAGNATEAERYISKAVDEIKRIEKLISSWDSTSQTSEINRNAGIQPVKVDSELLALIQRSIIISQLTDGAFDITFASMDKIWKFDGSMKKIPTEEEVKASVAKVGYRNIIIDTIRSTIFLKLPGMKIGFGAIGKGYAADMAAELLKAEGVNAGIINASGDMAVWGKQPDGKEWKVAVVNPKDKSKNFALLPVTDRAVVTSGDYERYVMLDGKRFAHIINPKTGYPATGIISVTVFAPKAELADALATAVFVMGVEAGMDRIDQLPNVDCIIVDEYGKLFTSKNIKINSKQ